MVWGVPEMTPLAGDICVSVPVAVSESGLSPSSNFVCGEGALVTFTSVSAAPVGAMVTVSSFLALLIRIVRSAPRRAWFGNPL